MVLLMVQMCLIASAAPQAGALSIAQTPNRHAIENTRLQSVFYQLDADTTPVEFEIAGQWFSIPRNYFGRYVPAPGETVNETLLIVLLPELEPVTDENIEIFWRPTWDYVMTIFLDARQDADPKTLLGRLVRGFQQVGDSPNDEGFIVYEGRGALSAIQALVRDEGEEIYWFYCRKPKEGTSPDCTTFVFVRDASGEGRSFSAELTFGRRHLERAVDVVRRTKQLLEEFQATQLPQ